MNVDNIKTLLANHAASTPESTLPNELRTFERLIAFQDPKEKASVFDTLDFGRKSYSLDLQTLVADGKNVRLKVRAPLCFDACALAGAALQDLLEAKRNQCKPCYKGMYDVWIGDGVVWEHFGFDVGRMVCFPVERTILYGMEMNATPKET